IAAPIAPQPMPYRAWFRQASGDFSPPEPGRTESAGTLTSCNESPEVTDARSDHLPWMLSALKPGVLVSTRKPRILLLSASERAQIRATSATVPLVIHIFSPFKMYSLPAFLARVRMPAGLEPKSGSVRPKQPSFSPLAMAGSHLSFCASLPMAKMGYITSEDCTLTNDRMALSPRSSSCITRPYSTLPMPAQP